jgi:valyl-tRNA synthetase
MDTSEMEKNWTLEMEKEITDSWKKKNPFPFNKKAKKIYSIDTPPPYVNTPIHIGQTTTYCYMDFFARYKRMKGFEVLFPLGLDRNGLPIEMAAEKKFQVDPLKIGREKFIEYCKKILEESSSESMDTFSRMGINFSSFKFGNEIGDAYTTDSKEYRTLTQATFYDMWNKGLVYEDRKVVNYCPGCHTTLADAEIEYSEKETSLIYIKFKAGKDNLIVATTRPELLAACKAILFNPEDARYKKFSGKTAISPVYNKEIKILAHNSAEKDFGTGLVMMCSFGDLTDIRFFKEQKLEPIILINEQGLMNQHSGFLQGLRIKEARAKIIQELKEKGLVEKEEQIMHRAPICERSKDKVEFIEMQEYYLKQMQVKDEIMKLQKKIKFYDESSRKILENWIESINQDWPLSRRRYYATPIPLWKCRKCGEVILGEKGKYIQPWLEEKKCKCGHIAEPETRVFDTWFDSSISELYILGYKKDSEFFKKAYPCSLRPQGKEIVRTWLYYTLLRAYLLTGKPCFQDVWINYHILDENKKKMSKSKGNVINPQEILKNEGSEAFRLWAAIEGDLSKSDIGCSEEKIKPELKTLNKLWNISKFIMQFGKAKKPAKLEKIDSLFIDYIENLTSLCDKEYEKYNFHEPVTKLRIFLWEIYASNYLELVKSRAYNQQQTFSKQEQDSAIYTLNYILERLLILLYPIIPAITSTLYKHLSKDIFKEEFPKGKEKFDDSLVKELMELNSQIWKMKKEQGLSLNAEIKTIQIPAALKDFEKDLKACHNSKEIKQGSFKVEFL